jgi:hypothetical protein
MFEKKYYFWEKLFIFYFSIEILKIIFKLFLLVQKYFSITIEN